MLFIFTILVTLMTIELDRYYTPVDLAESILSLEFDVPNKICVDTTCGVGNLLQAADNVFDNIMCIGLDKDKKAISTLRKSKPDWVLSVGDLMSSKSYERTLAVKNSRQSDLLLLNPPFSHLKTKSTEVFYKGKVFKASVAMSHILKSFELFRPNIGAMVIVPESVLYSETDAAARAAIEQDFHIELITELHSKTFLGANVRSSAIKILPGRKKTFCISENLVKPKIKVEIIRGGLPVCKMVSSVTLSSVPFIHSTDIREVISHGDVSFCKKTEVLKAGRLNGSMVLLPRVGVPNIDFISTLSVLEKVQLSDCVIALKFTNSAQANRGIIILRKFFSSLVSEYRGTGARYITINRLKVWLTNHGFSVL